MTSSEAPNTRRPIKAFFVVNQSLSFDNHQKPEKYFNLNQVIATFGSLECVSKFLTDSFESDSFSSMVCYQRARRILATIWQSKHLSTRYQKLSQFHFFACQSFRRTSISKKIWDKFGNYFEFQITIIQIYFFFDHRQFENMFCSFDSQLSSDSLFFGDSFWCFVHSFLLCAFL